MRLRAVNISPKTALLLGLSFISHCAVGQGSPWIATWTASPEAADPDPTEGLLGLDNQTVRESVRVAVGGRQLLIRLSNECSSSPVYVGRVSVGLSQSPSSVVPGSLHRITFGGREAILIPAGAPVLSDPVDMEIGDDAEISISLFIPKHPVSMTWHSLALRRALISIKGDHTQDVKLKGQQETDSSALLSAVLVPGAANRHVIVAFGDSIVDGDGSTEKDRAWPHDLFERLRESRDVFQSAVVNEGIAGNRLLKEGPVANLGISALARFERDALSVSGVTEIILLEGTNDIGFPGARLGKLSLAGVADAPTAETIVEAYRELIARAHARGVRLIGCTILPTEGVKIPGYHTEAKERIRQAVNRWIRTSHEFDSVIDFDAVVRDPDHPSRLLPRLASADRLHPNDAGYQTMADSIDLSMFR